MTFPYPFYGANPIETYTGDYHFYEIRFTRVPSDAERATLDAARYSVFAEQQQLLFEEDPDDAIVFDEEGDWKDEWVFFGVETRTSNRWILEHTLELALEAEHDIVPIDRVHALNARELGKDGWDAWSLAQDPHPALGPIGTDMMDWRGGFWESAAKYPFVRVDGVWVPRKIGAATRHRRCPFAAALAR